MEIQLNELIEQIKKDGVEVAENESQNIINSAKEEAQKIIEKANKKAQEIMSKAKCENEKTVKAGEDAIRQAGRNLLISFRQSVNKELNAVVGEQISEVYSSKEIGNIIADIIKSLGEDGDISVLINQKDLDLFQNDILSALKKRMLSGVTIKPDESFRGGFRIEVSDGTAFYDYSSETVTDLLSSYLNPKVTALMKEAENL